MRACLLNPDSVCFNSHPIQNRIQSRRFLKGCGEVKMLQSISHQIAQSPARLGLTSPNSPSLQNPSTPKLASQVQHSQVPQQQSVLPTTLKTTSTLLPLLPPLSRAQSLLLQMAFLASRLFEVSPKRSLWLTSFRGALPTFLSSQTLSVGPGSLDSTPSNNKEILSLFTTLQTQLFEAVAELQEILDLQDAKQKIAREIRSKDSAIHTFAKKLKEAERVLDILVDDYSDYRQPKRLKSEDDPNDSTSCTTVASQMNLSDILSYAHRISYTTFAPPEFGAGQAPLRGALPPAPQEEQMRASLLYSFADLDVGLPKTSESGERVIEALIERPPPEESEAVANLVPPNIDLPSDWMEKLRDKIKRERPAGWKLGDPVVVDTTLPVVPPPSIVEPPPRPYDPQVLRKEPEQPMQVRPVELDIASDSSDYSSDTGSSEDDD